ncbi:hypothetical protein EDD22DRAFT_935874 [Suillus occidentalis]|nr:hypothetical protein EDD22DRAFT_935874 [Suillus occidentalis]
MTNTWEQWWVACHWAIFDRVSADRTRQADTHIQGKRDLNDDAVCKPRDITLGTKEGMVAFLSFVSWAVVGS